VRLLALHQSYACRHSGVCCSSDWPIPVEAQGLIRIERARASGHLPIDPASGATSLFVRSADAPAGTPAVIARSDGRCVFHTQGHRCAIHEYLGHAALPLACRQFPRVTVLDPRGACVTLSHFCPTASALIQYDGYDGYDRYDGYGADIVINPPGFPPSGEYVGLDARDALPPLLRRDLLMDWDAWWHLEERAVATLLHRGASADEAVAMLRAVVARLGYWRPGGQRLIDAVDDAFTDSDTARATAPARALIERVLATVPDAYRERAAWTEHVDTPDPVTRRFLAAHAFANWQVHRQHGGLPAWLDSIETARAFLSEGAGVQQADLVLRHLAE
jgi:hypothetical protein